MPLPLLNDPPFFFCAGALAEMHIIMIRLSVHTSHGIYAPSLVHSPGFFPLAAAKLVVDVDKAAIPKVDG